MNMYGRIFGSIYDGSLGGNWKALVTFQQFLVLCDREGFVDMTPEAISRRTGIPLDIIHEGIGALEQPDPYSRTPDLDGRRIERIDAHRPWGWRIINYAKYRELRSQEDKREADRQRIGRKRQQERDSSPSIALRREVSRAVANVAHADADADADADTDTDTGKTHTSHGDGAGPVPLHSEINGARRKGSRKGAIPAFHRLVIDAYHEICTDLSKVKGWSDKRRKALDARIRERVADGKPADTIEYWRDLFVQVAASDFLSGRAAGDWRADLEWLLRPENFLKTIEGKYVNRAKPRPEDGTRAH